LNDTIGENWKVWASTKWNETWGEILNMPRAMEDGSYYLIVKEMYEAVNNTGHR
jgi:hypothetical protein